MACGTPIPSVLTIHGIWPQHAKDVLIPPYNAANNLCYSKAPITDLVVLKAVGVVHHILSFDMVNEKFSTSPLPEFGGTLEQYYLELLDFHGMFGAIFYPREGNDKSFDLWVMNGSWTKQLSVKNVIGFQRPLGFWKNGELFLESSDQELVLFDPSIQELRNLGVHTYKETMHITAYVES
ncbi:F-box protein At3g07870-like [Hibiscus syriacus]|uniref:F-box protein At3g07870-like n=1 Tax=Hibiscus syriacus TaxID=106335 RepID=UPI0019231CDA|nr:F-box protein At3g07870-like [Hibiscus syriacus]